jgi:TM2 domain-containing membrane protein YozV
MRDTRSSGESAANTPEGWFVEDTADYQVLVRNAPPRPGCFLRQMKADLRNRQVLRYWATGVGMSAVGLAFFWFDPKVGGMRLAFPGLALALIGTCWLGICLWLFLTTVRTVRRGPLLRGEIRSLKPHPLAVGHSTAEARLLDGRSVLVSVPSVPAAAFIDRYGQAEVLFLTAPDERQGSVIGIRVVARDRGADMDRAETSVE